VTRRNLAPLLALGGVLAVPTATAQQAPPDFRTLIVKSGKKASQAKLGSFCHPAADGTTGTCVTATYPLADAGLLSVREGTEVELLTRAPVAGLEWRAARVDGRGQEVLTGLGRARSVSKTKRRWRIDVPRSLSKNTRLMGFLVTYNGTTFSDFEVGVKVLQLRRSAARR
jgi:hypothetical protein